MATLKKVKPCEVSLFAFATISKGSRTNSINKNLTNIST